MAKPTQTIRRQIANIDTHWTSKGRLIPTGLSSRIKASFLFGVNTVLIRSSEVVHGKEVLILVIFKLWFALSF